MNFADEMELMIGRLELTRPGLRAEIGRRWLRLMAKAIDQFADESAELRCALANLVGLIEMDEYISADCLEMKNARRVLNRKFPNLLEGMINE